MPQQVHLFGIRHHGPGSARAVVRALDAIRPQCVLVEGPPDADGVIASAADDGLRPPVALLVYQADDAQRAAFYPFADFSPEWCAIRWAVAHKTPVRFMDLPQAYGLALLDSPADDHLPAEDGVDRSPAPAEHCAPPSLVRHDPLHALAVAAGFDDGERWWEHVFEHRQHAERDIFAAIREAMAALREGSDPSPVTAVDRDGPLREAWMRRTIREARRTFEVIAVVCGAWHVPALTDDALGRSQPDDDTMLKALAKVKTVATWIPWTYGRLAAASGYQAGVRSPGWYEHLWNCDAHVVESWMTRVARLLREQDVDCSSAHLIEATRLAATLAALRARPLADLSDIADACRAVFCFDSDLAMGLISRKLLIGERLGEVPDSTPLVPLQEDLRRQQKCWRLKPEALERELDLDLRHENDLGRSVLLHRLRLLGIDWGTPQPSRGGTGTFHEWWTLRWEPACLVRLIELGVWGNTIASAAAAFVRHQAEQAQDLERLAGLLGDLLLADLPAAVAGVVHHILSMAAVAADVARLMDVFPPLSEVFRYGNVRQTDQELVRSAIDGVLPRIFVGLSGAAAALNDEAAREMEQRIVRVHDAVQLLDSPTESSQWLACLAQIADQPSVHGLLRGRSTRLLFDHGACASADVANRLSLMVSRGTDPAQAAAWVEGFLRSSGLVLLHHVDLLALIDEWMCSISGDVFQEQVPLLRRTFAAFAPAERRQIGQRLRDGLNATTAVQADADLDPTRAARVLPVLRAILGSRSQGGAP